MGWWPWLLHVLGIDNVAGYAYAWWSGSGSVLLPPLLTLAGVAVLWWWHHRCHCHRCPRLGRYPAAGGQFSVCRAHSPDPAVREGLRAHHIHAAHQRWLSKGSPP